MQKYKITASKFQKKYQFVLSAENEKLAKDRVHKDGYSILAVELFNEENNINNTYIYEAEIGGKIKKGKVIGNNIFKIYVKLRDGMKYHVLKLYSKKDEDLPEKNKNNIIKELEEQYYYFKNDNGKKNKNIDKKIDKNKTVDKNEINIDGFYLKKQLEEIYKLFDFVLEKLNNLFQNEKYNLDNEKKEKLKNLYNSLIKIKASTNISKLKKVGEIALLKIGEIELKSLEKFKDDESKVFLNETNKLLKQIGSNKKFIPEDKDLSKKLNKFLVVLKNLFFSFLIKKEKKDLKNNNKGGSYYKYILYLNKYKQKLKENNLEILKNILMFIFPFGKFDIKKQELFIKRKVIKQNIYLFKAKINGKVFSYTKTIKGFNYILELIFKFFNYIKDYLFFVVFIYSLLFLLFLNFSFYNILPWLDGTLNYSGIFYFLIFLFIYFAIYFSRGIYSLFFNFVILFFLIGLSIINF